MQSTIDLKKLITICLLLAAVSVVKAQSGDNNKTFPSVICEYTLPLTRSGLSVTAFLVKPRIYLDRFEKSAQIVLEITKEQGTAQNPNPSFKYSYNYNGKQYGNESLGYDVFSNIKASDITYEVLVTYGSKSWGWMKVDGHTNQFGPVDKDAKASEINVRVKVVGIGSFSGTSAIENKIRTLLEPNTPSSNNSSLSNTSKQGLNNTATSSNAHSSTARKTTSGASSPLSQKVKVNGQDVQVYQQGGKYYMVNADGSQHETTKTAFEKVTTVANKNTIASSNAVQQEANRVEAYQLAQETQRQAYEQAQAAKAARAELTAQVVTQAAGLAGNLLADWQASRERKWAREKQEEENHKERIDRDRGAYSSFVSNQTNGIFKNSSTYQSMMKTMLPKVLDSKSTTWEDIIGAPDYNNLFGKDIKSVGKKLKITIPKDKSKAPDGKLSAEYLPKHFTQRDFYAVYGNHEFFYWVKTDFYEHACAYIFDHNDVLIGVKLQLHTSSQADKGFPSSLQEYISVKDYYDDLLKNTKGGYFLADGKTLITRDKFFILDFDFLTIYDLNFFDANTSFNLPIEFSQQFNLKHCNNCISKLGIKFQGFKADEAKKLTKVRITEVDKNSAAEKAGLLPDDIILNINNVAIDFPFHLQWYFLAFPDEKNINLKIERAKKTENISLTL